jgi:hypothetical protein
VEEAVIHRRSSDRADNCLYALRATLPHLTRSSLHRCLQRHGVSRLPEVEGDKTAKKKFKSYAIGFFHVDIVEVRTKEGKLQVARPSSQLRRPLQFRPQAQDPQRPHAIPVHLQMLDFGPEKIQPGSTPSNAGTKHLEPAAFARNRHREERSGAAIQMAVGRPMTPDCFASLAMTIVVRPICNLR